MFTHEQLNTIATTDKDTIITTPDKKYALYKFDRGDRFEIRMEEEYRREYQHTIGYMDTILRFFIRKEDDLHDTLYRLLRNCLLVERIK